MKRANAFDVIPQSDEDEELLRRLLDASAALWNEINYERRENYADPDGDVWDISEYRGRYGGTLGASTVQQIERKNREAWRSFFSLKRRVKPMANPDSGGTQTMGANSARTSETRGIRSSEANTLVSKSSSAKT
jgi:putative transposase